MQAYSNHEKHMVEEQKDKQLNGVGRFEKILTAVSSFWEGKDLSEYLNSNVTCESSLGSNTVQCVAPRGNKLDDTNTQRLNRLQPQGKRVEYFPPATSSTYPSQPNSLQQGNISPNSHMRLPSELRMITYSDDIPKPDLPPPPGPLLPDISGESPLTLLAAASGDALENLDNSVLENIVPRDPTTGRPLTLGSLEHVEGTCRPCIFFLRAKCFKGLRCTFCHFNHTALRKQVIVNPPSIACPVGSDQCLPETSCSVKPSTTKTKRLRPSKRTRELIKQINAQSATSNTEPTDLSSPPLSVQETTHSILPNLQVISRHSQ